MQFSLERTCTYILYMYPCVISVYMYNHNNHKGIILCKWVNLHVTSTIIHLEHNHVLNIMCVHVHYNIIIIHNVQSFVHTCTVVLLSSDKVVSFLCYVDMYMYTIRKYICTLYMCTFSQLLLQWKAGVQSLEMRPSSKTDMIEFQWPLLPFTTDSA